MAESNGTAAAESSNSENKEQQQQQQENKGDNWKFIPPQPMREDQVQNAVNFLSHPKVKGSPIVYRRSFLERKGLTREEIDEAFRRVPDPPESKIASQTATTTPAAAPAAPSAQHQQPVSSNQQLQAIATVPRKGAGWTQMVLAVGLLSAAGAGAAVLTKNYLFPRMKAWLRSIVLDEEYLEQKKKAAAAGAAQASVASNVAAEMAALARELISSRAEERRYFDTLIKSVEAQMREIKSSLDAMKDAQKRNPSSSGMREASGVSSPGEDKVSIFGAQQTARDVKFSAGAHVEHLSNGKSVRPLSAPSAAVANTPPHSASYMEVIAMLQRGEKPPNIREVNDKPPNASQQPSSSLLQPKMKPWESNAANATSFGVLDKPSESTEPWWRQKDQQVKQAENSLKIVEIEDQDANATSNGGPYSLFGHNESASSSSSRVWVPPPVPKTILPGVDAAIRHKAPTSPETDSMSYDSSYDPIDGYNGISEHAAGPAKPEDKGDVPEAEIVTKETTTEEESQ